MPGFGALGRFPLGDGPSETTPISWFVPLSVPARVKLGLKPSEQQFAVWQPAPSPFVATGWYQPLAIPARTKRGLRPGQQQFIAWQPAPSPFVATGWYSPLSTPSRKLPRNPAEYPPFGAWQPAPSPFVATGWFSPLSEPARTPKGLKPSEQQFIAWPPRILPTPTVTVTLGASESFDTMAAGVQAWNVANSAEIGVVNNSAFGTEIAVIYGTPSGTITSVSISIRLV